MDLQRPLPTPITPEAKPYWDGAREGKLMVPKCKACGKAFLYPRVLCPFCASRDIAWIQASGRGKLFSFEIAHQILNKAFKVKTPVVLAMVELEEGPRMLTNLINCEADPKKLRCDMPVEVVFEKQTDEISLRCSSRRGPDDERAQQQGLYRRRGRERRDRHAARQEHAQPAPGGDAQRHPRRRAEGLRHRRRVHRRPALAGHHRRGARA